MLRIRRRNLRWAEISMAELDLNKLILHFAQSNKAEGKSPRTVSWYTEMLSDFAKFQRALSVRCILSAFNLASARDFIIHEQNRPVSPYTVQGKVRALKAFSSWLYREGYTTSNLLASLKLPKVPIKVIEPLTTAEIEQLVSVQNPLTAIGSRNTAVLITLLDTGIRCSELSNLQLDDAHIEESYLKVNGKGNRERWVPIGALGQKVLWRYVFHFRPEPISEQDDYLFLTLDGGHLRPNAIKLLLRRWGSKAGVPRLHAHLCRHTYATAFLSNDCGDVFRLKQILGHNSLEMVNRYVHYASAQSMIRGGISSPMDRLGIKKLRKYKIDRILRNNCNTSRHV